MTGVAIPVPTREFSSRVECGDHQARRWRWQDPELRDGHWHCEQCGHATPEAEQTNP